MYYMYCSVPIGRKCHSFISACIYLLPCRIIIPHSPSSSSPSSSSQHVPWGFQGVWWPIVAGFSFARLGEAVYYHYALPTAHFSVLPLLYPVATTPIHSSLLCVSHCPLSTVHTSNYHGLLSVAPCPDSRALAATERYQMHAGKFYYPPRKTTWQSIFWR